MPAMTAFCASSKLARPDTCRTMPRSGSRSFRSGPADDLVDGVVAPDVLAEYEHLTRRGVEQCRRMQSAGLVEDGLPAAERGRAGWRGSQHPSSRRHPSTRRTTTRSRPRRSTPFRTRRTSSSCRSLRARSGDGGGVPGASVDIEDVVGVLGVPARGPPVPGPPQWIAERNWLAARDDPLRHQEARRQLDVVPGRAHRDRERRPADANLERLFDGERVGAPRLAGADRDPDDGSARRDASHVQPPIAFIPRAGWRNPGIVDRVTRELSADAGAQHPVDPRHRRRPRRAGSAAGRTRSSRRGSCAAGRRR